jgi:secreted trypsin-like serine protease
LNGPCHGDSGGPLVGIVNGAPVVLGVVSFGYLAECALLGQLGIFGRVSYHAGFIDEVIGRDEALGFTALCPKQPEVTLAYAPQTDGKNQVTVAWGADTKASGWRLYYAAAQSVGQIISKADLPLAKRELAVLLQSGQNFHVRVQALSSACDSPMSALLTVTVP